MIFFCSSRYPQCTAATERDIIGWSEHVTANVYRNFRETCIHLLLDAVSVCSLLLWGDTDGGMSTSSYWTNASQRRSGAVSSSSDHKMAAHAAKTTFKKRSGLSHKTKMHWGLFVVTTKLNVNVMWNSLLHTTAEAWSEDEWINVLALVLITKHTDTRGKSSKVTTVTQQSIHLCRKLTIIK